MQRRAFVRSMLASGLARPKHAAPVGEQCLGARATPAALAVDDLDPAAIERALTIYQQLQPRDRSVLLQARKILTQHIYGMVDRGESDEQRLTVGGLAHLKALEREHGGIKSAHGAEASSPA